MNNSKAYTGLKQDTQNLLIRKDDPTDLGVPMLPGSPTEKACPEDALGDTPTRGDYSGRLGGADYKPHAHNQAQTNTIKPIKIASSEAVELAWQNLAEIEQRIINGDETLTSEDFARAKTELAKAEDDFEFESLRERAALAREQRRLDLERHNYLLSLQNSLKQLTDTSKFSKLTAQIEKAVDSYLSAVNDHNQQMSKIRDELNSCGFVLGRKNSRLIDGIETGDGNPVIIGEVQVYQIEPRWKLEKLFADQLTKHLSR